MKALQRLLCILSVLAWPSLAVAQNGVPYSGNVQMPTFVIPSGSGTGLFPDGTTGAPSIAFASSPSTGFWLSASQTITANAANGFITTSQIEAPAASTFRFTGRLRMSAPADGGWQVTTAAGTSGMQQTYGADVTVTACGTGSVTAKSKNTAGEITATGATSCTVTFNTAPTFTNKPFCTATAESGTQPTITVSTTVSFTVAGLTSGAAFMYHCDGPI